MTRQSLEQPSRSESISEEAARWVLRQEAGPLSKRELSMLGKWLSGDPLHEEAYCQTILSLEALARHRDAAELMVLRGGALAARAETAGRRFGAFPIAFLACALAIAIGLWTYSSIDVAPEETVPEVADLVVDPAGAHHRTKIGERAAIALPDGSVATLDTDSEIRVTYSALSRSVHLLRGQAQFDVAKTKALPFQVYANGQIITAVGTVFNVRLDGKAVRVALLEGKVRVSEPINGNGPSARELVMNPGELLEAAPLRPYVVKQVDVTHTASWKSGFLVFNDAPLSHAVSEINRYAARPLVISDNTVGAYRISGVFQTNDVERFAKAMSEILPVSVTYAPDGSPKLSARQKYATEVH